MAIDSTLWLICRESLLRPGRTQDRQQAKDLFVSADGTPTALATAFAEAAASNSAATAPTLVAANGGGAKTFEPGVEPTSSGKAAGRLLTKGEKDRVRQAIEGAESVEEVRWTKVWTVVERMLTDLRHWMRSL